GLRNVNLVSRNQWQRFAAKDDFGDTRYVTALVTGWKPTAVSAGRRKRRKASASAISAVTDGRRRSMGDQQHGEGRRIACMVAGRKDNLIRKCDESRRICQDA